MPHRQDACAKPAPAAGSCLGPPHAIVTHNARLSSGDLHTCIAGSCALPPLQQPRRCHTPGPFQWQSISAHRAYLGMASDEALKAVTEAEEACSKQGELVRSLKEAAKEGTGSQVCCMHTGGLPAGKPTRMCA